MKGEGKLLDRGGPGRPGLIAGVELGGTKCICVLADEDGTIIDQARVATETPDVTLPAVAAVLGRWQRVHAIAALGIASFGPVDLDPGSPRFGFITATPKPGWRDTDVAMRLAAPLGLPVAFDTDVNGSALAEGRWGAARGLDDFAYVTLGTGVGVGLIVHGRPTRGLGHCELGHVRVRRLPGDDWPGGCDFHGGCVEGLASGTAIKARLGMAHIGEIASDHPVWDGVVDAVAQLAHILVLATGPRRIIVGGGVAAGQPHLLPRIEAALVASLAGYVDVPAGDPAHPFIAAPGLGTSAGPLGPIALALAEQRVA